MTRLAKLTALYDAAKDGREIAWGFAASPSRKAFPIDWHNAMNASLGDMNAALAFHNAVLPGWRVETLHQFAAGHWLAGVYHPQGEDWPKWTPYPTHGATAATPALALFLADLAALIEMEKPVETEDREPPYDCPGCGGGDKWPADEAVWVCPVCDAEYSDKETAQ
jgi:hypothetical protein